MKKNVVILVSIIIIGIISIMFWSKSDNNYYLDYANKIVDLYNGKNNTDGIKKKDLKAFNDFYKKLSHQDEMVDITDYFEFDANNRATGDDILNAIYINNKCYVKYEDLTLWKSFDKAEEGDAIVQRVSCNGYETLLFETMFMPPYERIIKDPKYSYIIDSYTDSLSGYTFKYKSTYDDSDLTVKLIIEYDKIIEVEVSY